MEGKYYTTKYQTPQGKGVNFTIDANKQKRNFALCLYHLNNKYSTSRIEEMFEFGEYVVKIEDELEFDKRIKMGQKKINISSIAETFYIIEMRALKMK